MSATTVLLPFRAARHVLGRVERVLRPVAPVATTEAASPSSDHDEDSTTTRELLVPAPTDEAPAARASRQAQDYLERRRRKLNERLDGR